MSRNTRAVIDAFSPVETDKVCANCGEHVHDEGSCLTCACGIYFAYETLRGNLVKPNLPDPPPGFP